MQRKGPADTKQGEKAHAAGEESHNCPTDMREEEEGERTTKSHDTKQK